MANRFHHDDPTAGGMQLPSLPKLYQNIFKALGMSGPATQADPSNIIPSQGMQDFYNEAFKVMGFPPSPRNPNRIQRYPDHPGHTQTGYGPEPRPYVPSRPDEGGSLDNIPYYPPRQSRAPDYTPPEADVPMPSFMRNRTGTQDQLTTSDFPDRPRPSALSAPQSQYTTNDFSDRPRPSVLRTNEPPRSDFRSLNTGPYPERPTFVGDNTTSVANMTPSTGRAHLQAPIVPSVDPRQDRVAATSNPSQPSPVRAQPKPPLHDTGPEEEDMTPGSLGEAQRLFPGQKLQQAIYYTQPETSNKGGGGAMQRLGVGADTSNLNPDYISRVWEPVNMTAGQRFMRGAYENPPAQPDEDQMASGGAINTAHKISREKATPCHVGLINMAVGGRTDHLPMHVREGSYVLPADIVSALGEGNTMAGSKVVDHMFANSRAHKAGGGATITPSQKPKFLESTRTLPGDVELGTSGEDLAGSALMANMFGSGPFGLSSKAPQFQSVVRPSLGEYGQMQQMFNPAPAKKEAHGGPILSGNRRPVPIVAAGGEYVIDPEDVSRYGDGDINKGHDKLDQFVKHVRKHLVKTLSKLPGPRRD